MGILSNRCGSGQQRTTTQSKRKCQFGINNPLSGNQRRIRRSNRSADKFLRLLGYGQRRRFHDINSWWSISVHPIISRPRDDESNDHTKKYSYRKRNQYHKRLYPVALALLGIINPTAALAESVGGVSATANPIANSSGSVTNQAIQVLQGPYITNTYGNQISCQGPTFNATPYIQYSNSWKDPWESTYLEPQYNNNDFTGRTTTQTITVKNYPWYDGIARGPNNADGTMGDILYEADGITPQTIEQDWYDNSVKTNPDGSIMMDDNGTPTDTSDDTPVRYFADGADMPIEIEVDGPDGIPDNPGDVIWNKPVRTDMRANNNFNLGLSATLSIPLDKKLQNLCKQAAMTQIEQQQQLTANKRLDFEIARLKNCGELMQKGIMFHPKSPYAAICADVIVSTPPGTIIPHSHDFPRPTFQEDSVEQPANGTAEDIGSLSVGNSTSLSTSAQPEQPQSTPSVSNDVPAKITSAPPSLEPSFLQRLWPFSRQASPPSVEDPPEALLGGPIQWPPSQSQQSLSQPEG